MNRRSFGFVLSVLLIGLLLNQAGAQRVTPAARAEQPCGTFQIYLPLIAQRGSADSMIIDRFGATYATAFQLPPLKAEDDWQSARPAVTAKVGGMSGVFDFHGSSGAPLEAQTIRKTFMLNSRGVPIPGSGTVSLSITSTTVVGSGTHFLTEAFVGDTITFSDGFTSVITQIADDTHLTTYNTTALEHTGCTYTLTRIESHYRDLDEALDRLKQYTLGAGETKLWGLLRTGSVRWAWAKCTSVKAPEKYGNKLSIPVDVEFSVREGVWYAESESSLAIHSQTLPYTFTLTNNGTQPAFVKAVLAWGDIGYLAQPKLENLTNGQSWTYDRAGTTDDLQLEHTITVDAAAYSVTDSPISGPAVDAYANLVLGANQVVFMQLEPGANSMRFSGTPSITELYDLTLTWFDTYQ